MIGVSSTRSSTFSCLSRFHELEQKVGDFQKRLGILDPVLLKISSFHKSPRALSNRQIIKVPSWFLFHYDDIPEQFRIVDCKDPRLLDEAFLHKVAAWMNGKMAQSGFRHSCQSENIGALQNALIHMGDRTLYEKGKDFILGHELTHILQGEMQQNAFRSQILRGLLVFLANCALIPFFGAVFSTGIAVFTALTCSAGAIYYFYRSWDPIPFDAIASEKDADLRSVQILGDATGAIHYFQTSLMKNLLLCIHNPELRGEFDEKGNNLADKGHPPLTERIAYLKEYLPPSSGRNL